MFDWLRKLFRRRSIAPGSYNRADRPRAYLPITVPRFDGTGALPPLHWRPCHKRTAIRFKAHMTCSFGHGIVLKDHGVSANGNVRPSVVCNTPGCTFHEVVALQGWSGGELV